jgi:hypothetical protein
MSDIQFTKPTVFTTGILGNVIQGAIPPNDPACNLSGQGSASWLLRFDTSAGTLETGGARPTTSPAGPYTFDNEMLNLGVTAFHVQPVTLSAPLSGSCTFDSTAGDLMMPLFLNTSGSSVVLLPLHDLRLHAGRMNAEHDCIGRYDAEGLTQANACQPDATHPAFQTGATLDGLITLAEADIVLVPSVSQTLCVILSGNPSMYGTQSGGVTHCNGTFQGDWCAATNQAATSTCSDAVHVSAKFAAQAVTIQ